MNSHKHHSRTAATRTLRSAAKRFLFAAASALVLATTSTANAGVFNEAFSGDSTTLENAALAAALRAHAATPSAASWSAVLDARTAALADGVLPLTTFDTAVLVDGLGAATEQINVPADSAGAIHLAAGASLLFQNSVLFVGNGGAFNFDSGGVFLFTADTDTRYTFFANESDRGGAIYSDNSTIAFNAPVTFSSNVAIDSSGIGNHGLGGAIYNITGTVSFVSPATFSGNTAKNSGGAIATTGTITFTAPATFSGNTATIHDGGAIYNVGGGTIVLTDATFINNSAGGQGGAIANDNVHSIVTLTGPAIFANNTSNGLGGAIFNRNGIISLADATFTENLASNNGGAIYNEGASAIITISGAAIFSRNTINNNDGGAIHNTTSGTISLADATFTNNYSYGYGGAIFNNNASVTISGAAVFSGNTTDVNFPGGAISNIGGGTITLSGSATFTNNSSGSGGAIFNRNNGTVTLTDATFTKNSAYSTGGAIFSNSGTLTLNVTAGATSLFTGNLEGANANSIVLENNATLDITTATAAVLDMRDPIRVFGGTTTITKIGAGAWKLGGNSDLNAATIAINAGTLHLYRAGEVANANKNNAGAVVGAGVLQNPNGTFTLGTGATLSSGGENAISATTITLNTGSTLAFDFAHASTSAAILTLTSFNFSIGTGIQINFLSLNAVAGIGTTYTLVSSLYGDFASAIGAVTLRGEALTGTRVDGLFTIIGQPNGVTLTQNAILNSALVSWANTSGGDWNITTANWTGNNTAESVTQFLHGDVVNFALSDSATPAVSITLNAAGDHTVRAAALNFSGATDYTFTGGTLETDATAGTTLSGFGAHGKLVLGAKAVGTTLPAVTLDTTSPAAVYTGTVDLTATNANTFTAGVALYSGTLRIASAAQLGTPLSTLAFLGDATDLTANVPTLRIAAGQSVAFVGVGDESQRLVIAAGKRGAIHLEAGATFLIENNVSVVNGGALFLDAGAKFDFTGAGRILFRNNLATETLPNAHGGAIYNASGTVEISGTATFDNNRAYLYGGAICNDGGTVKLSDAIFTNNVSITEGGAIRNYFGSRFEISGSATFTGNTAANGGAIFNWYSGPRIEISGPATFTGNTVTSNGGAIYNNGSDSIVTLTSADFTNNTAGNVGGAIFNSENSSITITGPATFTGNTASSYGGAIYNRESGTVTLAAADFSANVADQGGAISNTNGASVSLSGQANFTDNHANINGGAIYNLGSDSTVTLASVNFTNNYAGNQGGAIYNYDGIVEISGSATFSGNTSEFQGGAIFNSVDSTIKITEPAIFTGNTSNSNGGAIYNYGTTEITGLATFTGNTAYYSGGAIYNNEGSIVLSDSTFTGNTTDDAGGAIYNYSNSSLKITGPATFTENTSNYNGGAIYNYGSSSLEITGPAIFTGNTANSNGGAIYNYSNSSLKITGPATFTGNTAYSYGGAIYNYDGIVEISGSATFTGNIGGAIHSYGGGIVEISGSATFTGNIGGAITIDSSSIEITGPTTFTGNTADYEGGAIFIADGTINLNTPAGATSLFTGNLDSTGANSIFLFYTAILNINTADGVVDLAPGVLDMRDPMSGDLSNHITKTGAGTWKLGGTNALVSTTIAINEGTLYLYRDGEVSNANVNAPAALVGAGVLQNPNGTFTLGTASSVATLASSGGNSINASTITLHSGTTLAFDFTGAVAGNVIPWLTLDTPTLNGEAPGAGNITVFNASGLTVGDVYTLVNVGSAHTVFDTGTLTVNGLAANSYTVRGDAASVYSLFADNSGADHLLQLVVSAGPSFAQNTTNLVWAGTTATGGDLWRDDLNTYLAPNWDGTVGDAPPVSVFTFLNGDSVTFNATAANKAVRVEAEGVLPENVLITGSEDYSFSGGTVTVSDTLTKSGDSTATFANTVTADSLFVTGGTLAFSGTLTAAQVSVTGAVLTVGGTDAAALSSLGQTVVSGGGTLELLSDVFSDAAPRTLDGGTLLLSGSFPTLGGTFNVDVGGGTLDIPGSTREVAFTGAFTGSGSFHKAGSGTLATSAATFAGFGGGVEIAQGTLSYTGAAFANALSGSGTLAVTLGAKADAFAFEAAAGSAFTGTLALERGTLALGTVANAANSAALGGAVLALAEDSLATVSGSAGVTLGSLVLGGGELSFDSAGEAGTPLLTLTGALDLSAGGTVRLVTGGINTAAPAAGENLFALWDSSANYQRQIIAAGSVVPESSGALRVEPFATSATQVRELSDGSGVRTGEAKFDYTTNVSTESGKVGLWLGYGLAEISADFGKVVTLDATSAAPGAAKLTVPLVGTGAFSITGSAGQAVELGNASSRYTGDTVVSNVALTVVAAKAFGGVGALTLTDGASVASAFAAEFTQLNLAADTSLSVASLVVANGGVVDGVVTVAGVASTAGVLTGAGDWRVGSLANSGTLALGSVNAGTLSNTGEITVSGAASADISNAGTFTTSGDISGSVSNLGTFQGSGAHVPGISGNFENIGPGAFALLGAVGGDVSNAGTLTAGAVGGAVENSGNFTATGNVVGVFTNSGTTAVASVVGDIGGGVLNEGEFRTIGNIVGYFMNYGVAAVASVAGVGDFVLNSGNFTATGNVGGLFTNAGVDAIATVVGVSGDVVNNGDFTATGNIVGSLANNGAAAVATVVGIGGRVSNEGNFTATGNITGLFANRSTTAVAEVVGVGGEVWNEGTFTASGDIGGAFTNYGAVSVASVVEVDGDVLNEGNFTATGNVGGEVANSGVASLVGVSGSVLNEGTLTASGHIGGTFRNYGAATVISVGGDVSNSGTLTATGSIGGNFTNESAGAAAILRNVAGSVSNRDALIRLGSNAAWGALDNSGGYVDLGGGRELRVASLSAGSGTTGHVALALDPVNFAQSDRLVVTGAVSGTHVAVLNLAAGVDVNEAVLHVSDHTYVSVGAGAAGRGAVTGVLTDLGVRDYELTWDDSRSGYVLQAQGDHYSSTAQAVLNSAGAVSIAWFSQLDNLTKRLGDLRLSATRASSAASLSNAFWLRANAQRVNADLGISGVGGFREYQYGADVGYDRLVSSEGSDAQLYLGGFAAFQSGHRSFFSGHGKGDTDSAALGAYATWLHRDGWFVDGVVKGQYFDSDYDVSGAGLSGVGHGEFRNYGFGASVEFGRRLGVLKAGYVEPGVEISYAHVFAEDYTVDSGLRVLVGDSDILRYALGVRAGCVFDFGVGGGLSPYVKAGVERVESFGGSVRAATERWEPGLDGVRGRLGFGFSWQLDVRQQLHLDYEADFGSHYEKPWGLNAGYRLQF